MTALFSVLAFIMKSIDSTFWWKHTEKILNSHPILLVAALFNFVKKPFNPVKNKFRNEYLSVVFDSVSAQTIGPKLICRADYWPVNKRNKWHLVTVYQEVTTVVIIPASDRTAPNQSELQQQQSTHHTAHKVRSKIS